jgi:hypothetical protein
LEAAKADCEDGLLFNLKALVQAEILGDFLDQARVLFDAGYYVPAASLAGAVLIDIAGGRRNRIANDFLIGAYMQVRPIACSRATAVFIGGISRAWATAPFADNIN